MRRIPLLTVLALASISACTAPGPRADVTADAPADVPSDPAPIALATTGNATPATPPPAVPVPAPNVASTPTDVPRRGLALPRGWDTLSTPAFEDVFDRWNPAGEPGRLETSALDELQAALEGARPRSLRAVLLLSASGAAEAREVLRARLERRIRTGDPDLPAVDVAAAAALGKARDPSPTLASALEELAIGRRPHPVLAVRVECAVSSLALGRDAVVGYLLAVLAEGTPAVRERPGATLGAASIDELIFAQWRASTALAGRAGIDNPYRPEAGAVERARAAADIERAVSAKTNPGSRP